MQSSHFNKKGAAHMVDISDKRNTIREAIAYCRVSMKKTTLQMIKNINHKKGDVLGVARIAGITGAKKTSELIPLCHPISIQSIGIEFEFDPKNNFLEIVAKCKTNDKTGIEMEAMTAVTVSALTIYDMCKSVDKAISIDSVCLLKKSGGKSGTYIKK